jgi:hypothetical protein
MNLRKTKEISAFIVYGQVVCGDGRYGLCQHCDLAGYMLLEELPRAGVIGNQ